MHSVSWRSRVISTKKKCIKTLYNFSKSVVSYMPTHVVCVFCYIFLLVGRKKENSEHFCSLYIFSASIAIIVWSVWLVRERWHDDGIFSSCNLAAGTNIEKNMRFRKSEVCTVVEIKCSQRTILFFSCVFFCQRPVAQSTTRATLQVSFGRYIRTLRIPFCFYAHLSVWSCELH